MALIGDLESGKNIERTLGEMLPGESGYVFADALIFDLNKNPYLSLQASLFNSKKQEKRDSGTIIPSLLVKKIGPLKEDYDVFIEGVNYMWYTEDIEELKEYGDFAKLKSCPNQGELVKNLRALEYLNKIGLDKKPRNKPKKRTGRGVRRNYCTNKNLFPKTYHLRKQLNSLISKGDKRKINSFKNRINRTDEPLEGI